MTVFSALQLSLLALVDQSYVGRILVLDTAKGSVATAWMLHEMRSRNMAPLAIVFNTVNTILAQGAALGDVSMLAGFDEDVTDAVPHGARVEIDPQGEDVAGVVMALAARLPAMPAWPGGIVGLQRPPRLVAPARKFPMAA